MGRRSRARGKTIETVEPQAARRQYWAWIALAAIVIAVAVIRIRLLNTPLERDEGEFAYMGQLMLRGIPPYELAYNMKLPGIYAAYALVMALFGQTIAGIRFGFTLVNIGAIVAVFFLAKRIFNPSAGVAAAAAYAVMSVNPGVLDTPSRGVLGMSAHATHFVVLPAIGGLLLLLRAMESRKTLHFLLAGILLGTAFLMKQPGVLFSVFAVLYVLWVALAARPIAWRRLLIDEAWLALGIALPFTITCLALWQASVFDKFWFWTFTYGREYATITPWSIGMQEFRDGISSALGNVLGLPIMAGIGLAAAAWHKKSRAHLPFLVGFLVFSFLAVCPGLYFRQHYFVLFLPAVALLVGAFVGCLQEIMSGWKAPRWALVMPLIALIIACWVSVASMSELLFHSDPVFLCRSLYGINPFVESVEVSKYIKAHSNKDDRILVFGSEPQIYFYTGLRSATGVIYTYPLMEEQKYAEQMQRDMIAEVERAKPEYIVVVQTPVSWLQRPNSPHLIFDWLNNYLRDYRLVGIADMVSLDQTDYYWGRDTEGHTPTPQSYLLVARRIHHGSK